MAVDDMVVLVLVLVLVHPFRHTADVSVPVRELLDSVDVQSLDPERLSQSLAVAVWSMTT